MLSSEELVRRCSYAVALVTGVDPWERRHELKGDDGLQIARKLWVHLLACEFGVSHSEASRILARNRETIIISLREIEDWRDAELHPRGATALDNALEVIGEALKSLVEHGQVATEAMPTPIERSRMNRLRAQRSA